jgi:alanyl-tRNA synthetase
VKRLYWTNPDVCETEVEVESVGDRRVTTNPIVFHPDEGGQPADRGAIGRADVVNVEIVDGRIIHTLSETLGDGRYVAEVDRQHRLNTARQHTAQHIISGIAEDRFDLKTTGVHIGLDTSTIDFTKKTDWQTLQAIERRAMEAVAENIAVETVFDDTDVRSRFDLSQIESDTIRVVKIGEYDASACCGAHVLRTGDIGIIRFIDLESKRDGTRLHFAAGVKALDFSQTETAILRELRKISKCSTLELPVILEKALAQSRSMAKEVDRLHGSMLPSFVEAARITEIGASKVGVQVDAVAGKYAGKLAGLIAEHIDGTGIVVSDCNVAISSKTLNAGELFQKLYKAFGGKGGGSPRFANGRLEKAVTSEQIVEIIKKSVRSE